MEVVVEVHDPVALEKYALDSIDACTFATDDGDNETARQQERALVMGDAAQAVSWIADPYAAISDDAGVEATESSHNAVELDSDHLPITDTDIPDFATQFPACTCNKDSCAGCSGLQLTPRTASVLWSSCQLRADLAYEDVIVFGDEPSGRRRFSDVSLTWVA